MTGRKVSPLVFSFFVASSSKETAEAAQSRKRDKRQKPMRNAVAMRFFAVFSRAFLGETPDGGFLVIKYLEQSLHPGNLEKNPDLRGDFLELDLASRVLS